MLSGFIWDLSLIIQKITRSFKRTVDFFNSPSKLRIVCTVFNMD